MNKRDYRIDYLRFIAIFSIMLAHVNPPRFVFNIRSFDVSLMTMLMSMAFVLSYKPLDNYLDYVKKRFQRLIIPAWIFLTVFFIIFFILNIFVSKQFEFSLGTIISSFGLISGIGYILIIRIFFTIALLNPILYTVVQKTKSYKSKLGLISILLLTQYLLASFSQNSTGLSYLIFNLILANSFGYMIVALVGMFVIKQNYKENIVLIIYFLLVYFLKFSISQGSVSDFKYPPFPYYLSYGILISLILWTIFSMKKIRVNLKNPFIIWCSKNSLNLYYWHIIPVFYFSHYSSITNWIFQASVVYCFAFSLTYIQTTFLPNFFNPKFINKNAKNRL